MVLMPNNEKAQTFACDVCGGLEAQTKYMTRTYGKGDSPLVMQNVPVVVCPSCGESYLTAETLHRLEQIKPLSVSERLLLDERLRQHEGNLEDVEPWDKVRNDILSEP